MSDTPTQSDPVILGDFLEHLKGKGFDIGVDDYLRVQQLLSRPEIFSEPSELKLLLCPILATSEKQQKQFYAIFESFFSCASNAFSPPALAEPQAEVAAPMKASAPGGRKYKWLTSSIAAIGILFFGAYAWLASPRTDPSPPPEPTPSMTFGPDTRTIVHKIGEPDDPAWAGLIVPPGRKPIPREGEIETNAQLRRNWKRLVLALGMAPLLAAGLLAARRRFKQRRLRSFQSDKTPPFNWPLTIPKTTQRLHEIGAFNAVTRALRRRQQSEMRRLDVESTISATVASSGFPALRFRSVDKVPEYLILIDRATLADHQARFFGDFAARLGNEDIFVESYFYDGDPRYCYRGDYRKGVSLHELPRGGQRILVYGSGARLLEPNSGELVEWAECFADWDDRVLLSPIAPAQWGARERKLSELFPLLPATLEGLREAVAHFELHNNPGLLAWRNRSDDCGLPDFDYDESVEETADRTQMYLGDDNLFQWICACAAYPTLQWDLTLCLGEQVMPGGELWEKDILRLVRLPWFEQGLMPEDLRRCLFRRLSPENQKKVSAKLIGLLQETKANLPEKFENSWAQESLNLQIEIQQWLLDRTSEQARSLRRKLRELPPSLTAPDYARLRDVDAEPLTPWTRSLLRATPESWRNRIWPYGLPPLGMKPAIQWTLASIFALSLATFAAFLKPPSQWTRIPAEPIEESVTIARPSPTSTPKPTPTITPPPPEPCFSPEAGIAVSESLVPPGALIDLTGYVQGGRKYGDLSFDWSSSLGRIRVRGGSGGMNQYVLDTAGVAPGADILLKLTVTSSSGNCIAASQKIIQIRQSAPVLAFNPSSTPDQNGNRILPEGTVGVPYEHRIQIDGGTPPFRWRILRGELPRGVSLDEFGRLHGIPTQPSTASSFSIEVSDSSTSPQRISFPASLYVRARGALMPNLVGMDLPSARQLLDGLELKTDTQFELDSKQTPNTVIQQEPKGGEILRPGQRVTLHIARPPSQVCYDIRLDRIQVIDNGSSGAAIWSFNIFETGRSIMTLPEKRYFDDKRPQKAPERKSFLPDLKGQAQSLQPGYLASGSLCIAEGRPMNIRVVGVREGEKEPDKRDASGEQIINPSAQPISVSVRLDTKKQGEGEFVFYFTISPSRPEPKR